MSETLTLKILEAIEKSPAGIASLDVLVSLRLCDAFTLKTILSRLNKRKKILRLKRGVYSTNPLKDAFAAAQATFGGYLAFSTALYLHKIISETPFTIYVATTNTSLSKTVGQYVFKAVALGEKAVGFERKEIYVLSTKPKTLFDCIYLSKYSVEEEKLTDEFKEAELNSKEWKEFNIYVKKFVNIKNRNKFYEIRNTIMGN